MRLAIVALSLLVSSTGLAQEPPLEFNAFALGSDIAAVKNSPRFSCGPSEDPLIGDEICRPNSKEMLAGAPIVQFILFYYSGKLESIYFSFEPEYFSQVADALKKQYGKGSLETKIAENRQGARSESRVYSWRRDNTTIRATEYQPPYNLSMVEYRTDIALQEYVRRKDASATPTASNQPRDAEILAFCAKQWPTDFVMQAHCVEQQRKAAEALQGTLNVPTNVSTIIRQKCTADWPEDFQMRAHCEQSQAEAWRKLNPGR